MKYKTVIWDFNGTIMDDVALCMDSLNTMLKARGIRTVDTVAEYHKIFRFPIKEYYRLALTLKKRRLRILQSNG